MISLWTETADRLSADGVDASESSCPKFPRKIKLLSGAKPVSRAYFALIAFDRFYRSWRLLSPSLETPTRPRTTCRSRPPKSIGRLMSGKQRGIQLHLSLSSYALLWLTFDRTTFDWNAIATLAVWIMTLFIQRTNRRDSLALHAKLDELLRVDRQARSELSSP
jgi:hypothetical protein